MMDKLFRFSDGQTSLGSNTVSDFYSDLTGGTDGKDAFGNAIKVPIGDGKLYVNCRVNVAVATAALTVDLYTATGAPTSSGTKVAGMSIPLGAKAGSYHSFGIPAGDVTWLRYAGIVYDAASAGTGAATSVDTWVDISPVTGNVLPD